MLGRDKGIKEEGEKGRNYEKGDGEICVNVLSIHWNDILMTKLFAIIE